MIVHQVYALIDSNETVQNIMVCDNYEEANRIARAVYGDNAFAVDCLQYPCSIGSVYHNGRFCGWRKTGQKQRLTMFQHRSNRYSLFMQKMMS